MCVYRITCALQIHDIKLHYTVYCMLLLRTTYLTILDITMALIIHNKIMLVYVVKPCRLCVNVITDNPWSVVNCFYDGVSCTSLSCL